MDDEQLRAELQKMIAREVRAYLTAYRAAGTAELSKLGAELKSEMDRLANNLRKQRAETEAAFAVPGQVDHVVRTWGRAILTGALMFAALAGAAWIAIAWTEQQFRWQVAKTAEIAERIAAQEHTLDQINRESGGLTLTGPDNEGHCFVLFPAAADVTTFWRVSNRPAVEVECDE